MIVEAAFLMPSQVSAQPRHRKAVSSRAVPSKGFKNFEFKIQEDNLYMLQTLSGQRNGLAAEKIAVDMLEEGLFDKEKDLMMV